MDHLNSYLNRRNKLKRKIRRKIIVTEEVKMKLKEGNKVKF